MAIGHSPAVRRVRLGAELRDIRESRAMTIQALSALTGIDGSRISRIETGKAARTDIGQVMDILDALGVTGERANAAIQLARQANQKGWWKALAGPAMERYRHLAELEAGMVELRQFATLLPGLLQTADYARSLFERASGLVSKADVSAGVEARMARQRILNDPQVRYEAILDEAVLSRRPCLPEVMREQLWMLATARDNVTVRVLPLSAGHLQHLSPTGFSIFRYRDPQDPTVVFIETIPVDLVLDDSEDVNRHTSVYEQLQEASMSVDESRKVILQVAEAIE